MTDGFLYELSKLLECPVCMETFENPKQLWCGHTLCLKCFNELKQPYIGLRCPLCRIPTRAARNQPPHLYIVQDFVQLYNKIIESRKYVDTIMPLLKRRSQSVVQPSNDEDSSAKEVVFSLKQPDAIDTNSVGCKSAVVSTYCLECNLLRDVDDLWLCSDCATNAICSRCILLKQHAGHTVTLYVNILDDRKAAVQKWRESVDVALDAIYKNRVDLEYGETRLKILRLQQSKSVEYSAPPPSTAKDLLMNFEAATNSVDNEFLVLQNLTTDTKNEFAELRIRLAALQNKEAFLLSSEESFSGELASLSFAIEQLCNKQTSLLEKQQTIIDKLSSEKIPPSVPSQLEPQQPTFASSGGKGLANQLTAARGGGHYRNTAGWVHGGSHRRPAQNANGYQQHSHGHRQQNRGSYFHHGQQVRANNGGYVRRDFRPPRLDD